jgi:outer membrane biosynthesis protein TonB
MNSPIDQKLLRPRALSRGAPRRRGWLERYRMAISVAGVTFAIGGVVVALTRHDDQPPAKQVRELTVISLPPPPPPPPPPPDQKPIEETKLEEQPPEFQEQKPIEEAKADPVKDAKADEPPGPLSLDAKGQGPGDAFGLGGKPGGSAYGGGGGGGGGWGWYASIVQSQLRSALESNKKTRKATMRGNIRIWADQTGRVIRVQLAGTTGDAELDAALRSEVFGNLTLREPPPKGMPMPMIIRITEQRPS